MIWTYLHYTLVGLPAKIAVRSPCHLGASVAKHHAQSCGDRGLSTQTLQAPQGFFGVERLAQFEACGSASKNLDLKNLPNSSISRWRSDSFVRRSCLSSST